MDGLRTDPLTGQRPNVEARSLSSGGSLIHRRFLFFFAAQDPINIFGR
jgi:hypothetical protein